MKEADRQAFFMVLMPWYACYVFDRDYDNGKKNQKQWIDFSCTPFEEKSRIFMKTITNERFCRNFHNLLQTSGVDLCYNEFVPNAKSDTWSIWCISPKRARPWGQLFANGDAETGNMKPLCAWNEKSIKIHDFTKIFFYFWNSYLNILFWKNVKFLAK